MFKLFAKLKIRTLVDSQTTEQILLDELKAKGCLSSLCGGLTIQR